MFFLCFEAYHFFMHDLLSSRLHYWLNWMESKFLSLICHLKETVKLNFQLYKILTMALDCEFTTSNRQISKKGHRRSPERGTLFPERGTRRLKKGALFFVIWMEKYFREPSKFSLCQCWHMHYCLLEMQRLQKYQIRNINLIL